MQNSKHRFSTACYSAASDPMKWCGAQLDMVDMYTEIPTPHVRDAVVYALTKVEEARRSRRPISCFAVLRNAKSEDRLGSAASSYFGNTPLHLVLDYIDCELPRNGLFRVGAWVLDQNQGLLMGGPNSAQLACIYMAVRETKNTAVAPFTPHILACRYGDNIYLFGQRSRKQLISFKAATVQVIRLQI